ncbi:unnamed protein product [Notodromas monacha]|uniref:UNC93-like protein MFSD11 n=1 Tax=Notodromas monacha TaxID=399045 RepID=A0A7R9BV41_9CRUS|nr:unnamed protein product [Notodromas monacha]CAG0921942.1 unnamed protein product [Notodromas monacha]
MRTDRKTLNIFMLGFAFMFLFTAFQTAKLIEKTVLASVKAESKDFGGDAYVSLGIVYAFFAVSNWLAPSVVSIVTPKWTMVIGAVPYLVFVGSFLYPNAWLLYISSAVLGMGAALLWTGQGSFLTLNSDEETRIRNSGIFWAMNDEKSLKEKMKRPVLPSSRFVAIWVLINAPSSHKPQSEKSSWYPLPVSWKGYRQESPSPALQENAGSDEDYEAGNDIAPLVDDQSTNIPADHGSLDNHSIDLNAALEPSRKRQRTEDTAEDGSEFAELEVDLLPKSKGPTLCDSVRRHQELFFTEPFISTALAPTFLEDLEKSFLQPINSLVGIVPRTNAPIYKNLPIYHQQLDANYQKAQKAIAITHRALVQFLGEIKADPEQRKKISTIIKLNSTAYLTVADHRRKAIMRGLIQQHPPMAASLKAGQFTCQVYGEKLVDLSDKALLETVTNATVQEATLRSAIRAAKGFNNKPNARGGIRNNFTPRGRWLTESQSSVALDWDMLALAKVGSEMHLGLGVRWDVERNLLPKALLFGNTLVTFQFRGATVIEKGIRTRVFLILLGIETVGFILLCLLRQPLAIPEQAPGPEETKPESDEGIPEEQQGNTEEGETNPERRSEIDERIPENKPEKEKGEIETSRKRGALSAFFSAVSLLGSVKMLLLCTTFAYTGIHLTFYGGVYSAAIGFTEKFGSDRYFYVGVSGILIGCGQISGSLLSLLMRKLGGGGGEGSPEFGRTPIVICAAACHLCAFVLIFINIPNRAVFETTSDEALIESRIWLALLCSFMLGIGDTTYLTQLYATVSTLFAEKSAESFAVAVFFQAVCAATAFFYSSYVPLRGQLAVLGTMCIVGTTAYSRFSSLRTRQLIVVTVFCAAFFYVILKIVLALDDIANAGSSHPEIATPRLPKHLLCILIPFRDRFTQLTVFVPHMNKFLRAQKIQHRFVVINQIDNFRFNRAFLLNVGFREAPPSCTYFALHDVDLLPLNPDLSYGFPEHGPFHVASPEYHPKYDYPTFTGGILLLKRDHYAGVNGMSNRYWGWGLEDDEFRARLVEAGLVIGKTEGLKTHRNDTFRHIHTGARDYGTCFNQYEVTRKRDRQTGLNTTKYEVHSRPEVTIDGIPVAVLNILLKCNKTETPWCECDKEHYRLKHPRIEDPDRKDVIVPLLPRKKQKTGL